MKWCYQVEVDETETSKTKQELLDIGLVALASAYRETGAYFNIGYNPQFITSGKNN